MEYRNPRVSTADGWIDCEINHPVHGWVPFTANPNDAHAQFDVAALHASMAVDPALQPYSPMPEPAKPTIQELMDKLAEIQAQITALGEQDS